MPCRRRPFAALALVAVAALAAPPLAAQRPVTAEPGWSLAAVAGASQYDLSGTGTAPHVAARATRTLPGPFLLELGVGFMTYEPQFGGERERYLFPEAQLQLTGTVGRVAPYLGVGGGGAVGWISDAADVGPTASIAGGVRVGLTPGIGLAAELRVRGIGSEFSGSTAEWTAGLNWRP